MREIYIEEPSSSEPNEGGRTLDEYRALGGPLLHAAIKGDWPAAKAFLEKYPDWVRAPITKQKGTALNNAVMAQHTAFTKELLKWMTPKDLELKNIKGATALHYAAQSGIVRIAEQLVEMNNKPLLIHDCEENIPLHVATCQGHTDMVSYLFSVTPFQHLAANDRTRLLLDTIYNDMYGFKGISNKALMNTLAHQLVERLWKMVGIPHNQFSSNMVQTLILEAAKVGNVEFLIILIRSYPDLIWQRNENNMSLFHIAIVYRQESVFNLIYELGTNKNHLASCKTSETNENMLHLAGQLAPLDRLNIVSGAALQMQRELLWFKEIEKIVPLSYVNMKNFEGETPKEIFIKRHTYLQKDGEKWMKDTANYCMLVATLIATVIFAAAFTVPGGSNQETGTPIFLRSNWFMVFFISDTIALCSSSTSIAIFLSILTSRYTEEDFYRSLPSKLVFGLATLFISMAGMMVAFSATCFLVYRNVRAWVPVVVITSVAVPVTSFVVLHHKLWVDTFLSTYKSRFLFRPNKRRIF
ncbi:ankyrin repeat-containing protein ITN1-like isoform X3 [Alnus glutinosa]|uniref:ankyrin repeat-containing protein ITN1-like isoform X3 n=1 Tax=Alnus glutinosa TaxID=3517 RepID=UPI002D76FAF6|nr:ankyrin repeat-containing protein ITN1-like isoform X3 [Alnus glutinosa]